MMRAQLFALTQVLPERQKLLYKGKAIKDTWGSIECEDDMTFLMMGTVGEIIKAPTDKVLFMEDLADSELVGKGQLPPGLKNLGNTCYLNATVQCLQKVPELRTALSEYVKSNFGSGLDGQAEFVKSLSMAFNQLDNPTNSGTLDMAIVQVWNNLKQINPQFAEMGHHGYSQQDAAESFNQLMVSMQSKLPNDFVNKHFGIEYAITSTNDENPEEAPTVSTEKGLQLACHIKKGVGFLNASLKEAYTASMVKNSASLNRDAQYTRKTNISRLPAYVAVNFVRFFFKKASQEQCKIGREMKFSNDLDLMDFVTPELRVKLTPARNEFEDFRNSEIEKEVENKKHAAVDSEKEKVEYLPSSFPEDEGSNNSGYYELVAVLTHKGRTANSGHYVAWTRYDDNEDNWACFDDDKVTQHKLDRVLKLSGESGADSDTAYMLIYGPKRCPKTAPKQEKKEEATAMETN